MNKRGIVFVFVSIFLIASVSAVNICSDPSQVILKLSDVTNAHGENATLSNYNEEICYDDIFGVLGSGDWTCGGADENLVLRLNADTNAHGEGPAGTSYPVKICYADLTACELTSAECATLGKTEIVSLSDVTNAHLASDSSYSQNICCVGASPPVSVFWADTLNNSIDTKKVYINNTVRLITTGASAGETITFEVFEDDPVNDDDIRTLAGTNEITAVADPSGTAVATMQITQADYDAGWTNVGDAENEGDPMQLFFTAEGTSYIKQTSAQVNLQPEVRNTAPVANITSPLHRQVYFVDTQLEFNQSSYDIDGEVSRFEWTITGESVRTEASFQHTFTTPGMKTITLKVTDNAGLTGEDQIAILVIASPGMLAFINTPEHWEIVRSDTKTVSYNGSDSYVVDQSVPCVVDCLAGNCPTQTGNSPVSCGAGGGPLLINSPLQGFNNLFFNWTFLSDSGSGFGFNTGGLNNASEQIQFGKFSKVINDKLIELKLEHSGTGLIENVNRVFTLLDGDIGESACVGNQLWEFEGNTLVNRRNVDVDDGVTPSACAGPDGNFDTVDDNCECSISGWICTEFNGCQAQSGTPIERCSDYGVESECNDDTKQIADDDELWDENDCDYDGPDGYKNCYCAWKSGECTLNVEFISYVTPGSPVCTYNCSYVSNELASCSEGYVTLDVSTAFEGCDPDGAGPEGAQECSADNKQYQLPCGRPEIELPFFGVSQFILSFSFIVIFYILIILHRHIFKED